MEAEALHFSFRVVRNISAIPVSTTASNSDFAVFFFFRANARYLEKLEIFWIALPSAEDFFFT